MRILAASVLSVLLFLSASLARADDMRAVCAADVQKLCSGLEPGDGRIAKCLHQNEAQLSDGCKSALGAMKTGFMACRADARRLCADAGRDRAARLACLKDHQSELSPDCASMIASLPSAQPGAQ